MAVYAVRDNGSTHIGTGSGDGGRYASVTATDDWDTAFGVPTTGYYDSIEAALQATTPPTPDDFILVGNDHDFTQAGSLNYGRFQSAYPIFAVSVDIDNVGQALAGAKESTNSGGDITMSNGGSAIKTWGISFFIGDDIDSNLNNTKIILENGTVDFGGSGDKINADVTGALVQLTDIDIVYPTGSSGPVMIIRGGATVTMLGGSVSTTTGTLDDLVGGSSGVNGGMHALFSAVNLADIDGYLLGESGGLVTDDDAIDMLVDGCELGASLTGFVEERFISPSQRVKVVNSSSVAAPAEYEDFESTWVGDIEDMDSSGIVRIDDVTFESGENTSLQLTTTSDCSLSAPLVFEISGRFAKLSTAGEDTLIIRFAVVDTVTLTDANFYAEIVNPNGATANQFDYSTNRNADILAVGTEWTDDSGSSVWEDNGVDLTGYNEYRMGIPITGGGDGYPIIRLNLSEPSLAGTMYVSKDVGVS